MSEALHTERLDLTPVTAADAQETWPLQNDERMWRYFPHLRPATAQALRAKYERWAAGSPDPAEVWLNWLCRERSTGAPVGLTQATVRPADSESYVAYAIFSAYQRQGYAREAVAGIIGYLRERFGCRKIFAHIHAENAASRALAESLGFVCKSAEDDELLYELAGAPLAGKSRRRPSE